MQDRIRQLHRELLKQVRKLYNTPRLVDLLVHGLTSKNNRTRVETAEAIGEIIHDEGVHIADKARHKPLPALAQVGIVPLTHMQLVYLILKHANAGPSICQRYGFCTSVYCRAKASTDSFHAEMLCSAGIRWSVYYSAALDVKLFGCALQGMQPSYVVHPIQSFCHADCF